jgi:hypothetical protein
MRALRYWGTALLPVVLHLDPLLQLIRVPSGEHPDCDHGQSGGSGRHPFTEFPPWNATRLASGMST